MAVVVTNFFGVEVIGAGNRIGNGIGNGTLSGIGVLWCWLHHFVPSIWEN